MFSKKYRRADKALTAKLKHHGKWLRNSVTVTLAMGMTAWIAIPTSPVEGAQIITSGAWIGVNASSLTLPVGTSYHIFFRLFGVTNNNTRAPEAVLDNPSIGTYDASTGVFTAGTKPGTGTLTIQMRDGSDAAPVEIPITVTVGPLDHVAIDPQITSMEIMSIQQFTLVGFDRYGNKVDLSGAAPTWSASGNLGVFVVPGAFYADGGLTGQAAITATLGGISATEDVRIYGRAALFDVTTDGPAVVGKPTVLHVRVEDVQGNSGPSYTGPVYLAAGGGDVSMPSSIQVSGDAFEVPVTFHTAGQVSLVLSSQKSSDDIYTMIAELYGQTVSGTTTIDVQAAAPDTSDVPVKVNGTPLGTIHCLVSDQEYISLDSLSQFLGRIGIQVLQPADSGGTGSSLDLKVPKWIDSGAPTDPDNADMTVVTQSIDPTSLPVDIHPHPASKSGSKGTGIGNSKVVTATYMYIADVQQLLARVGMNGAFSEDDKELDVSAPLTISGIKPLTPGQNLPLHISWGRSNIPAPANLVQWQSSSSDASITSESVFQAEKPGEYEVTGMYNGIPVTGSVTVDPAVSRVQISVGPPTADSNHMFYFPVTVTAYDSQNQPMPDVSLEFSRTGSDGVNSDEFVKTDQQGTYTTTVSYVSPTDASGTGVIRATSASGASDSATLTYGIVNTGGTNNNTRPSRPVPVPSRIQPTSPSVTSTVYMNPSDSTAFHFTVFTSSGDPVPNTLVDFSVNGGLSASGLDHAAATTDANGVATVHYTANSSDTDGHIHAVVHGSTISTDSAAIHVSAAAPAIPSSIQVTPASGSSQYVAINQPTTVTFAVYDSSGQTVPGVQLDLNVSGGLTTDHLSTTSAVTDHQGLATVSYTPAVHDTPGTVTASVYGSPSINVASGVLQPVMMDWDTDDSVNNDQVQVQAPGQVTFRFNVSTGDEQGVSSLPMTFTVDPSLHGQLNVTHGVTDPGGTVEVTYTADASDAPGRIHAQVDGTNISATSPMIVQ